MPVGEENTGLLRRRLIFADPERSIVRISWDGTRIAFRAPVEAVAVPPGPLRAAWSWPKQTT